MVAESQVDPTLIAYGYDEVINVTGWRTGDEEGDDPWLVTFYRCPKCWALVDDRNQGLAMRKHKSWHEDESADDVQPSHSASRAAGRRLRSLWRRDRAGRGSA
jgi:hypothetical protein